MMWMEFQCEAWFVAEPPLARQHFSSFVVWLPRVLLGVRTFGKLFFRFLNHGLHGPHGFQKTRSRDLSIPAALESYQLLTISYVTAGALASGEASVSVVFAA
jgi:hypothetical protein